MEKKSTNIIENLYDKYSVMLYDIALEISPSAKEADIILISTFVKIHDQNIIDQENSAICATLIKLVIQSAHEVLMPDELEHNFRLKRFENSPLLHKLLCEQINKNDNFLKNKSMPTEHAQKVREEFITIRNLLKDEKLILSD